MRTAWITALMVLTSSALGALPTFTGEDEPDWTDGGFGVITAQIKDLGQRPDSSYVATLLPRATVTGNFDPGLHAEIQVEFDAAAPGVTSIRLPLKTGDLIIAVLQKADDGWIVTNHICRFMPDGSAIAVLKNLDDPRVAETLAKIQAARAKGKAKQKTREKQQEK